MQKIFFEEPYQFVPPHHGEFWVRTLPLWFPRYLRSVHKVTGHEIRGARHFKAALDAGHSVVITPNHSRYTDPMVMAFLYRAIGKPFYSMAGWHLFKGSPIMSWMLSRLGAFSVYREGPDREAVRTAIDILAENRRPLVLFPEGIVTHANDRLAELQDGVAFIARQAAKRRAEAGGAGKVVLLPTALKYVFKGDLRATVEPILEEIERRLTWPPHRHLPLVERIYKIGEALLSLKEVEYLGRAQAGTLRERLAGMVDAVLGPHEQRLCNGRKEPTLIGRIKKLRGIVLPELISGGLTDAGRAERWKVLSDTYLAQQLNSYPGNYVRAKPTPERILETVERFDEDLNDYGRPVGPLHCIIECGEPIEVAPVRVKGAGGDPLMESLRDRLQAMLDRLAEETRPMADVVGS